MHCHGRVSGKGFAGGYRLLLDGVSVVRSAWQKARAKNLNTVHVFMKRFNKIQGIGLIRGSKMGSPDIASSARAGPFFAD